MLAQNKFIKYYLNKAIFINVNTECEILFHGFGGNRRVEVVKRAPRSSITRNFYLNLDLSPIIFAAPRLQFFATETIYQSSY